MEVELDSPANAMLDAAEDMIRRTVALGLGPQIEARLGRLLPKKVDADVMLLAETARELALANVLSALKASSPRSDHATAAVRSAREFVVSELAIAKTQRRAS